MDKRANVAGQDDGAVVTPARWRDRQAVVDDQARSCSVNGAIER
jgi:hypothetical protein